MTAERNHRHRKGLSIEVSSENEKATIRHGSNLAEAAVTAVVIDVVVAVVAFSSGLCLQLLARSTQTRHSRFKAIGHKNKPLCNYTSKHGKLYVDATKP